MCDVDVGATAQLASTSSDIGPIITALATRSEDHRGVPVGALVLQKRAVAACRSRMEHLMGKLKMRGVSRLSSDTILLHLPPSVAGALDDAAASPELSKALSAIISDCSATYLSGVRNQDVLLCKQVQLPGPKHDCVFKFAELFAGIGGFRMALEPLGGRCELASEIDAAACSVYRAMWLATADDVLVGDITGVPTSQLAPMDMLTAGFPCQAFSERGLLPGLFDERGVLYKELVRILSAHQPGCFLFENVPGLVTMEGGARCSRRERRASDRVVEDHYTPGKVFEAMLAEFEACGYDVSWRVISTRHWLPQHRERVYIVGFRVDLDVQMPWADLRAPDVPPTTLRGILEPSDSNAVAACELSCAQWETVQAQLAAYPRWGGIPCPLAERTVDIDGLHPTLTSSYHQASNFTSKFICEEADGTLRDGTRHRPRFLTPRECARLMGFSEAMPVPPTDDVHATGRFYRLIGNAAAPPVLRAIASLMVPLLSSKTAAASGSLEQLTVQRPDWWGSEYAFHARLRAGNASALTPCVLDASPTCIHNFARGDFGCVEAELTSGLGAEAMAQSVGALSTAGVQAAFELRRELVAFKKACLFVFHDAQKLEAELQRMELFFFRDREADRFLRQQGETEYVLACRWRQRAKGLLLAVHDARTLGKLLCCLPRHPDLESADMDQRLATMTFGATAALGKADAFLTATRQTGSLGEGVDAEATSSTKKVSGEAVAPLTAGFMNAGLDLVMAAHRRSLASWPAHVNEFVRLSLIAHGAAKAISIRDGFLSYRRALAAVHRRTRRLVAALEVVRDDTVTRLAGQPPEEPPSDTLRALLQREVHVTKHLNLLIGLRDANELLLQTLKRLNSEAAKPSASTQGEVLRTHDASAAHSLAAQLGRCFVAADGSRGVRSLFVPDEFAALCSLLAALDGKARAMDERMRAAILIEGWPPPLAAGRTRVKTAGAIKCRSCGGAFSKQWALREICCFCEGKMRASGVCPFDSSAPMLVDVSTAGTEQARRPAVHARHHSFCAHQSKCVVCDGGFLPCPLCRLARGNGERCAEICADVELFPSGTPCTIFLDFDRTLCSTKGGRSPLAGIHSTDAELAGLTATHPTYVVTRNPHHSEIETFLAERKINVAGVHVVPKRASKADVMLQLMPSLADEANKGTIMAVFVDDDIRELTRASVAGLPLLRVLFSRTGL